MLRTCGLKTSGRMSRALDQNGSGLGIHKRRESFSIFHHFPIKAFPELRKSRQSSVFVSYIVSFPSFGRGFDSHRPLQILKDLGGRAGFHYFQNINFTARLHGKFGANVVERNLSGVAFRHRS